MSTAAILLIFVIVFGVALVAALIYVVYLLGEVQRLTESRHARPRPLRPAAAERPDGAAPVPGAGAAPADPEDDPSSWDDRLNALSTPGGVPPAQAADHADALWQASEPYLPGAEFLPRRPKLGTLAARTVPVAQTPDAPPWETSTAVQPAIAPEIDRMRAEYLRAYVAEHGDPTPEMLRDAMHGLRNLPAPTTAGPELARRVMS